MEINWKVISIFGIIGFFLSFLVGIISGVAFGAIILRGFISGILFGGVGFGITVLIKKFLPELSQSSPAEGPEGEDSDDSVNIIIDDDADTSLIDEVVAGNSAGFDAEQQTDDLEEDDSFVEEVEEKSSIGNVSSSAASPDSMDSDADSSPDDEAEEVSELLPIADDGNIDSLPDIGAFSSTFTSADTENEEPENDSNSGSQFQDSAIVDVMGKQQDTRVIAKAVQTMLKKE